jgi:hypothetical protein
MSFGGRGGREMAEGPFDHQARVGSTFGRFGEVQHQDGLGVIEARGPTARRLEAG